MKKITKISLLSFIVISIVFCGKGQVQKNSIYAVENGKITIKEFLNYKKDVIKQAELVNELDKKSKIEFLKDFFPHSSYYLGFDSYGTVAPNGLIIIDDTSDNIESKLHFAKWEIVNDRLIITAENNELLGYNKLVVMADNYHFDVKIVNKKKGKELKYLILKFLIEEYKPERSKLLQDDKYDDNDYIGHGPATDKIKEYYKKMGWKTEY